MVCQWRPDASSWKLIAAHLTIHLNGGPSLAIGTTFGCQNWSPGPILAAKFGLGGPVLAKFLPKSVRGDQFLGGPSLV